MNGLRFWINCIVLAPGITVLLFLTWMFLGEVAEFISVWRDRKYNG